MKKKVHILKKEFLPKYLKERGKLLIIKIKLKKSFKIINIVFFQV